MAVQAVREGLGQPPLPVGTLGAGGVDAGLRAQMKPVCERDDCHIRSTGEAGGDHGLSEGARRAAQVTAGVGHILGGGSLLPALGGDVIVRAGVDHAVGRVGVGQVVARLPAVKGKLHDLHARVAAGGQHGFDLRGQVAQVLGNDAALTQTLVHGLDERTVRTLFPVAARCRFVPGGDGVVALKAAEVVDADHVVNGGGVLHPALPPGKVRGLMPGPVVERVAPELAVGGKGVWRAAGHLGQVDLPIGLEELRVGPQVAGIRADIDGNVTHQLHAFCIGIGLEGVPLGVEEELHGLVIIHLLRQPGPGGGQCFRLTGAQSIRPVGEACLMLLGLDGHEQGVILQPEVLPGAERVVGLRGGGQQPVGGLFQHQRALAVEGTIINGTHRLGGGQLGLGQETLLDQQPVINEIGVACESGKALVRAVSVAGRANGQDLPIGLLRSGQKIHKRERFFAQCANAKGAWQAEHGHQDAACTHFGTLLVVLRLTLDSACHDALNDVLLAGHVQDDDGDDGNDDAGHHGGQLHAAIAAAEVLDGHGDGAVFLDVQHQRGQEVVVPDPHGLQNGGGDHGRLEDGENDLEEDLEGVAAVDHGGLLDLNGDALHEAGEHEDGQARAEAQIDDADVPRGVQLEGVRRFGQGEHDHLEWHDHGEDDEQVHELAELVVDTGEVPARHGAAQQDEHHAGHRDEQAVAQAGEEVHLEDAVDVVGQARKRLFGGQLEDGGGGERALHLETVN